MWQVSGPINRAPSPCTVNYDGRTLPCSISWVRVGRRPPHSLTGTTAPLCLHGCNSPADGESDLYVSVCALYILLVGNEFTNPLSTENRAFPRAEQMGKKAF